MVIKRLLCIMILSMIFPVCTRAQVSDDEAIGSVKTLPVSKLDPALPNTPFSTWLAKLAGDSGVVKWEVNDCGEQTGNSMMDIQSDVPISVEVDVTLPRDREWSITVNAGSDKKGLVKDPVVSYIDLVSKGKYQSVKHLHDLQGALHNFFK